MTREMNAENLNLSFEKKFTRLNHLRQKMPQYEDMLNFFEQIMKEREKYQAKLTSAMDPNMINDSIYCGLKLQEGLPLIDKKDIQYDKDLMASYFKALLNIVKTNYPSSVQQIENLIKQQKINFATLYNAYLGNETSLRGNYLFEFLITETISPLLKIYAEKLRGLIKFGTWDQGFCPICGDYPEMAVLTNGNGKRLLICPACGSDWHFLRTRCPFCKNADPQQLSYYFVENDDRYRIELCDKCRQYLKTVDLRNASPNESHVIDYDIENLITLHLDIIARDRGYTNNHPVNSPSAALATYH
jgi:FdhE protein